MIPRPKPASGDRVYFRGSRDCLLSGILVSIVNDQYIIIDDTSKKKILVKSAMVLDI